MGAWRHLRAIALLPFMAAVVVPAALTLRTRRIRPGWGLLGPLRAVPVVLGVAFIASGLFLFIRTVRLFASAGEGTLAPWDETQQLVVEGVYRHVRNPMITGGGCILLGEASLLGSPPLLAWAAAFFGANAPYIPLLEERGLERRFGDDYRVYRRHVPAWIPRLSPWQPLGARPRDV